MLSNLPNPSTVFGDRSTTQGSTYHREQIIANAKLLHGQEHTYDVVTRETSSNLVTAYLIRYLPPSDESIFEKHKKAAALPIGQGEGESSGNSGGFIIPRGGHAGHQRFSILERGTGPECSRNKALEKLLQATERRLRDGDILS